MDRYCF